MRFTWALKENLPTLAPDNIEIEESVTEEQILSADYDNEEPQELAAFKEWAEAATRKDF